MFADLVFSWVLILVSSCECPPQLLKILTILFTRYLSIQPFCYVLSVPISCPRTVVLASLYLFVFILSLQTFWQNFFRYFEGPVLLVFLVLTGLFWVSLLFLVFVSLFHLFVVSLLFVEIFGVFNSIESLSIFPSIMISLKLPVSLVF